MTLCFFKKMCRDWYWWYGLFFVFQLLLARLWSQFTFTTTAFWIATVSAVLFFILMSLGIYWRYIETD